MLAILDEIPTIRDKRDAVPAPAFEGAIGIGHQTRTSGPILLIICQVWMNQFGNLPEEPLQPLRRLERMVRREVWSVAHSPCGIACSLPRVR